MTSIVFEEIPDKVTLAVDISNCRGRCEGCHSPFLRDDVGEELSPSVADFLIADNFGVNCFLFLGEGNDIAALLSLAAYIRSAYPGLSLALYSGRTEVEDSIYEAFDYVKVGPYIPARGPLNVRTTNQRLYFVSHDVGGSSDAGGKDYRLEDITSRFWHHGIDPNV